MSSLARKPDYLNHLDFIAKSRQANAQALAAIAGAESADLWRLV
jgi:hypothetical protein